MTRGEERGDPGYVALTEGCALVGQPERAWLVVSGEDRQRFVNGLVTCDVRDLQLGEGVYGFFCNSQGRVLADVVVNATEQSLFLDLPSDRVGAIAEHMLKFKVADRVEVEPLESRSHLIVAGPTSAELVEQVTGVSTVDRKWVHWRAGRLDLREEGRLGVPATRIVGSEEDVAELTERLESAGAVRAGPEPVKLVRVERGVPWFGVDFGEQNFPQETGLEGRAVSYSKGCYLGQEIVARIHHRGHVNQRLFALRGAGSAIEEGGELLSDGEKVGEVTSSAVSPQLGGAIALAMVHRKAGECVTLADGSQVSLVELPFARAARR